MVAADHDVMGEDHTPCSHTAVSCVVGHWTAETAHQTTWTRPQGDDLLPFISLHYMAPDSDGYLRDSYTFSGSLHVSFQAAGSAAVLRAGEAPLQSAGSARELTHTILVIITATSRNRASRNL